MTGPAREACGAEEAAETPPRRRAARRRTLAACVDRRRSWRRSCRWRSRSSRGAPSPPGSGREGGWPSPRGRPGWRSRPGMPHPGRAVRRGGSGLVPEQRSGSMPAGTLGSRPGARRPWGRGARLSPAASRSAPRSGAPHTRRRRPRSGPCGHHPHRRRSPVARAAQDVAPAPPMRRRRRGRGG